MRPQDVIRKKRDGRSLSREEIEFFIAGVTSGRIADYQVSALLMAIYLNGMDQNEQQALTEAMLNSGNILDFSDIPRPKADKHIYNYFDTRLAVSNLYNLDPNTY